LSLFWPGIAPTRRRLATEDARVILDIDRFLAELESRDVAHASTVAQLVVPEALRV
jgi:hypothetical protein